eukprot:c16880_g1_i2.p1 GENE.c16880_g1_i2~~c16880_g1_i2.p1  ORF type:complete len:285 (+),score=92.42 c16880_g1_i2:46-855(+)
MGPVPGSMYPSAECFECKTPNRTFHIFAETSEYRDRWVKLLNDHIQKLSQEPPKPDTGDFELRSEMVNSQRVEFLTKSGGIKNLSWKKRLFLLSGEYFLYYELPQGLRAQGNYTCQSCRDPVEVPKNLPTGVNSDALIELQTSQGKILVAAMNADDKNRWIEAIMVKLGNSSDHSKSVSKSISKPSISPSLTQDAQEIEAIKQQIQDLTEMKEKSDKIIRALKNENKKHKQTIEELNGQIQHKDKDLHDIASSLSSMREELMAVHDSRY